jgi:hypothetical protein
LSSRRLAPREGHSALRQAATVPAVPPPSNRKIRISLLVSAGIVVAGGFLTNVLSTLVPTDQARRFAVPVLIALALLAILGVRPAEDQARLRSEKILISGLAAALLLSVSLAVWVPWQGGTNNAPSMARPAPSSSHPSETVSLSPTPSATSAGPPASTTTTRNQATSDCPKNWFCGYGDRNFGYPRMKLRTTECGRQDLAIWGWNGRIRSASYQLPDGVITFYDEGSRTDDSDDTALFALDSLRREIPDVAAYTGIVDYAIRQC